MLLQLVPTGGSILKKMLETRNVNVLTGTTAKNAEHAEAVRCPSRFPLPPRPGKGESEVRHLRACMESEEAV